MNDISDEQSFPMDDITYQGAISTDDETHYEGLSGAATCKNDRTSDIELFCWHCISRSRVVQRAPSNLSSGVWALSLDSGEESLLSCESFGNL